MTQGMNSNIKVSITMLAYNHEKYIEQAIESVLMQEVDFEYELLIGEDCSTDGTLEKIKPYLVNQQIKLFARERNMSKSEIGNEMDLRLRAKGKYITLLEGDDYWTDPHRLQKQVDFLDSNPEYIACAHGFVVVDEEGKQYYDRDFECQFFQSNPYNKNVFENGQMLSHINSIMYRNFYNEIDKKMLRFFTDYRSMGGDYLLTAFLVLNGKMYCLPDKMSCYRKVVSNKSDSFSSIMERKNTRDLTYKAIIGSEKYINQYYNISFEARKKSAFASAVFMWNRNRTKHNFSVVCNIIKMSKKPVKYTAWFVYLLLARFVLNILNRKDYRVKF